MRLILASASPRRAELLRCAGFTFEVIVADIDERVKPGEAPEPYVRRLASNKSRAALAQLAAGTSQSTTSDVIVLGSDTAVVVDGLILGKPRDDSDARMMLERLSGRWHDVLTGVSLRTDGDEVAVVETTRVEFARLTADDMQAYVDSGEGRDKAGAYAIQGLASRFIPRIDGSYANVVGLPVTTVGRLMAELESRLASRRESSYSGRDSSRKPL
ncbi:MAG TPA: Maf family protein [Vicinamibacterales bacterium]